MRNVHAMIRGLCVLCLLAVAGCAPKASAVTEAPKAKRRPPLDLLTSADFGCVPCSSGRVWRIVRIVNRSKSPLCISRWSTSCECLSVSPTTLELPVSGSTLVKLEFDSDREGESYEGDLRILVEGFADSVKVGEFDVPISIISREKARHLGELSRTSESS